MTKPRQIKKMVQTAFAAVAVGLMCDGLASTVRSAEPKAAAPQKSDSAVSSTNSVEPKAAAPDAGKVVVKRQLTGAELYSIHCNRCHPERYPTERTAAQWKTAMLHMQVRANIPGNQAKLILQYLQDNSGR